MSKRSVHKKNIILKYHIRYNDNKLCPRDITYLSHAFLIIYVFIKSSFYISKLFFLDLKEKKNYLFKKSKINLNAQVIYFFMIMPKKKTEKEQKLFLTWKIFQKNILYYCFVVLHDLFFLLITEQKIFIISKEISYIIHNSKLKTIFCILANFL